MDADPDDIWEDFDVADQDHEDDLLEPAAATGDDGVLCEGVLDEGLSDAAARGRRHEETLGDALDDALDDTDKHDVPMIAVDLRRDPIVRPFAPPLALMRGLLDGCNMENIPEGAQAIALRARLDEEDMPLQMSLGLMREGSFVRWAQTNGVHWKAMYAAVQRVIDKLDDMRGSLPGADTFTG